MQRPWGVFLGASKRGVGRSQWSERSWEGTGGPLFFSQGQPEPPGHIPQELGEGVTSGLPATPTPPQGLGHDRLQRPGARCQHLGWGRARES